MDLLTIDYKTKTAEVKDILIHLNECKDNFIPQLDKTVDIPEYSKKIVENSVTFEAWIDKDLIGLIAAYFNDTKDHSGFITNVSVIKEYSGKGVASQLLKNCINYAVEFLFKDISLEVSHANEQAIGLYKKNDFYQTAVKGDLVIMKKNL